MAEKPKKVDINAIMKRLIDRLNNEDPDNIKNMGVRYFTTDDNGNLVEKSSQEIAAEESKETISDAMSDFEAIMAGKTSEPLKKILYKDGQVAYAGDKIGWAASTVTDGTIDKLTSDGFVEITWHDLNDRKSRVSAVNFSMNAKLKERAAEVTEADLAKDLPVTIGDKTYSAEEAAILAATGYDPIKVPDMTRMAKALDKYIDYLEGKYTYDWNGEDTFDKTTLKGGCNCPACMLSRVLAEEGFYDVSPDSIVDPGVQNRFTKVRELIREWETMPLDERMRRFPEKFGGKREGVPNISLTKAPSEEDDDDIWDKVREEITKEDAVLDEYSGDVMPEKDLDDRHWSVEGPNRRGRFNVLNEAFEAARKWSKEDGERYTIYDRVAVFKGKDDE